MSDRPTRKREATPKKHTTARLSDDVRQRLEAIAAERNTTVTAIIEIACQRLLAENAILDELRAMEERVASTVVRTLSETARVGDDVQLVIAQVDQLIRFMFQVTPEIFDKRAAGIIGSRRYTDYLADFAKQFQGRKRRASFVAEIEGRIEEGEGGNE